MEVELKQLKETQRYLLGCFGNIVCPLQEHMELLTGINFHHRHLSCYVALRACALDSKGCSHVKRSTVVRRVLWLGVIFCSLIMHFHSVFSVLDAARLHLDGQGSGWWYW